MRFLRNFQLRNDIYSDSKPLHYRISSNKRPRSDNRPPPWPKYQTSALPAPPPAPAMEPPNERSLPLPHHIFIVGIQGKLVSFATLLITLSANCIM